MFTLIVFSLFVVYSNSFFIPVSTSSSITNIAKSIELPETTIVISRNSTGHPIGFCDFCGHRGASFDNVQIQNNNIKCPYHGFEFDVNGGELVSGLGVKKGCANLSMIECLEKDGLVWACVDGDNSIVPPDIEESSDPGFRKITGSAEIKCPIEELISNIIDACHISFVHSFGNTIDPEPIDYKSKRISPTRGVATFKYNSGKTSMFDGNLDVFNWYDIPYTAGTRVISPTGDIKTVRVHALKLKNGNTKFFWELYRNWQKNHFMDSMFDMAMRITLDEDKNILEKCSFSHGNKFNGKYDKLQLLYRKSMKTLLP